MKGFAGGALAGAVVGAAALAGLTILGPREPEAVVATTEAIPSAEAVPRPVPEEPAPVAEAAVEPVAEPEVAAVLAPEDENLESPTPRPADPTADVSGVGVAVVAVPSVPDLAAAGFGGALLAEVAPVVPGPEIALPADSLAVVETPAAPDAALVLSEPVVGTPIPVAPDGAPDVAEGVGAPGVPEVAEAPALEQEAAASSLPGRVALGGRALPGGGPVRVNRPGIEEAATQAEPEVPPEVPPADAPALQRHAAAWEAPDAARPLLSVVLLDDGATDPQAVAGLPWPVSVALDPEAEGAAERLAVYRAAGVEALVLARLPEGATPVDVEVFLGAALATLPETVAVLDLGEGGLGGRDAVAQMAMSRVARDGRGVVLGEQGFRSGLDLAAREGVPAAEILRDLDGEGQDTAAVGRGLDDAVRRAGQEGRAVVLGRVGPGTLAALAEWSQEGRAREVTVAPVSGVLGGAAPQE